MKKPAIRLWLVGIVTWGSLVLGSRATAQNLLTNGNFETGSTGAAPSSPWTVNNSTDGSGTQTTILLGAAAQSPFSSGTQGAILTDASPESPSGHSWTPLLGQVLSSPLTSGTVTLSLDFDALQAGGLDYPWTVILGPSASSNVTLLSIGSSAGASTMSFLNVGGSATTYAFTSGTWYNLTATLDLATHLYSATITPFGGTATTFNNLSASTLASVGYLGVGDGSGSQVNGQLYVDNASLAATPEPSAAGLLLGALACGGLALRRRLGRA